MEKRAPFERVVTEHGGTVLRVCRGVLGPHPDADDAWAETFLAALRAWPDLPADANVQAWLVTIAHRKAIDVLRARARHAVPVDRVPEGRSSLGDPDAAQPDLWAALARLPQKQRLCVVHHHLGGLPYRDVAALTGGTEASARRAAADGVATLRRLLAVPDDDHDQPGGLVTAQPGRTLR
ncbi:RNA polymerase sigma factor [Tersicoccus phoenicis]|uniref:RNA polymerase sigma factor n=1 Tax=Tersicoccus phoenicis TaxID=554083 RepID=UPI000A031757|nr:sigma-70 family RNA polymerase sigma factor [Tersicoccus phoenicis]